jgi:prepilin-type N-terminal cleavage/methylation domain-containing protein
MRHEKGFTLIEILVAIAILGIITASMVAGFGTVSKVFIHIDTQGNARISAVAQMEFIKSQTYNSSFDTTGNIGSVIGAGSLYQLTSSPSGYSAAEQVLLKQIGLQQITIIITGPQNITYTLSGYKTQ